MAEDVWDAVAAIGGVVAAAGALWAAWQAKGAAESAREGAKLQREVWEEDLAERGRARFACSFLTVTEPVSSGVGLLEPAAYLVVQNRGQGPAWDVRFELSEDAPVGFRRPLEDDAALQIEEAWKLRQSGGGWWPAGDRMIEAAWIVVPGISAGEEHRERVIWPDELGVYRAHAVTVTARWADRASDDNTEVLHLMLKSVHNS